MKEIFFDEISISFLSDLYSVRLKAEARKDESALTNLRQRYPELFSEEIEKFLNQLKIVAKDLDFKHGTDFSSLFSLKEGKEKAMH